MASSSRWLLRTRSRSGCGAVDARALPRWSAGRRACRLSADERVVAGGAGLEPGPSLQKLERSILQHDAHLDAIGVSSGTREVCPFKGLAFFDRADADYFCGRERLSSDLLARLVESTLVGILGPSGIGKSSLLRAGVLSRLSAGALPGSREWRQLLLRPGERPCAEFQRALGGGPLADVLRHLGPGERIVVAVDSWRSYLPVRTRARACRVLGAVDGGGARPTSGAHSSWCR